MTPPFYCRLTTDDRAEVTRRKTESMAAATQRSYGTYTKQFQVSVPPMACYQILLLSAFPTSICLRQHVQMSSCMFDF